MMAVEDAVVMVAVGVAVGVAVVEDTILMVEVTAVEDDGGGGGGSLGHGCDDGGGVSW